MQKALHLAEYVRHFLYNFFDGLNLSIFRQIFDWKYLTIFSFIYLQIYF